jgi:hypothetical protein
MSIMKEFAVDGVYDSLPNRIKSNLSFNATSIDNCSTI